MSRRRGRRRIRGPRRRPPPAVAPAGRRRGRADGRSDAVFVTSPFVGTFYRSPSPEAAVLRRGGPGGPQGPGGLHRRGDEADERDRVRGRRQGRSRSWSKNGEHVEYGQKLFRLEPRPEPEPSCSRRSSSPTGARSPCGSSAPAASGHAVGGRALDRRRRRAARALRRREGVHRPAAGPGQLPERRRPDQRRRGHRRRRRPPRLRLPVRERRVRRDGGEVRPAPGSARSPRSCARWATRSRPARPWPRPACPSCPAPAPSRATARR